LLFSKKYITIHGNINVKTVRLGFNS
jgi:hypothetical protein